MRQQEMGPAAAGADAGTDNAPVPSLSEPARFGGESRARAGYEIGSALGDRQRDEAAGVVARHLDQDRLLAGLRGIGDRLFEITRGADIGRVDREDRVAGLDAALFGGAALLDLGHDDALAVLGLRHR